jgi:hypothetical protein
MTASRQPSRPQGQSEEGNRVYKRYPAVRSGGRAADGATGNPQGKEVDFVWGNNIIIVLR